MGGRQIEQSKLTTFSLLVIAATCLAVALYWTRPVMVPFMLALFLTHLVAPLVDGLQIGLKAPRWAALLAAFLVIASLLSLLTLLLITSVGGLMENVDTFKNKALELIDQILGLLTRWNIDLGQEDFMARIQGLPILPLLQNTVGGVMNFLTTSVLVALFAVFMILGRQPKEVRSGLWGEMDRKIRRYLATKVITSAVTGILVGGILGLFGLDLAMVFGFMAFLLNFIPSVGSIIATLLPIPIHDGRIHLAIFPDVCALPLQDFARLHIGHKSFVILQIQNHLHEDFRWHVDRGLCTNLADPRFRVLTKINNDSIAGLRRSLPRPFGTGVNR